jgi:tetratricopeptide (TPR) repeat protein
MRAGDRIVGRFHLERAAGVGGMGRVFRAQDLETGHWVALKSLEGNPARIVYFDREAAALQRLAHPGIVEYVAHGRAGDGTPFLVMEWLEGVDLGELLAQPGSGDHDPIGLPFDDCIVIASHLAAALACAHAAGVVHRDIKPSNVLLVGGDVTRVKLLDFGVAGGDMLASFAGPSVVGTPGYMAPEQARGDSRVDARADVFSLGCLLFECLTGRPAFAGTQVVTVLARILLEPAPRLRELLPDAPPRLDSLLARMLDKDPERRPRDGAAVLEELKRLARPRASDMPRAPSILPVAPSLTDREQRLISVVMADTAQPPATEDPATAPTLTVDHQLDPGVRAAIVGLGGRVETLVDGSVIVTLETGGAATDQAACAARCALRLLASQPLSRVALATARGEVAGKLPIGDVIERAGALVRALADSTQTATHVLLDETTASLLDERFEIAKTATGLQLRGERDAASPARLLLGRPTPCVGRERELRELAATFEECVATRTAAVVLVTGAAGVGKSRLRRELVARLGDRGVRVWIGRADPARAGSVFGMLAPVIRSVAGIVDNDPLEQRRSKLAASVAARVALDARARVTEFLGEMIGTPFPDDSSVALKAARWSPVMLGDQMRRAWEDFVRAEVDRGPLLLVLEDVHWGDRPSLSYVDSTLRVAGDAPWMVLALARPEIDQAFPKLWAERTPRRMALRELAQRDCEELARVVLGRAAGPEIVREVVRRAAGNAFYLEELLRAVAAGQRDLPDTVLAMVQSRLEALDPEARRALRAASLFGDVFWIGAVAALLGATGRTAHVRALMAELQRLELVAPSAPSRFAGEEQYAFRHDLVREAALAMLVQEDRALGHRLAAEWLERVGEPHPAVIAGHYELGGERARAVDWYLRAAERALAANDLAQAVARAEQGVTCGATGEALGTLRLAQARASTWLGQSADAARFAAEAVAQLHPGSGSWYGASTVVAAAATTRGDVDALRDLARLHLQVVGKVSAERAMATAHLTQHLVVSGEVGLARDIVRAVDLASEDGSALEPIQQAHLTLARAYLALHAGDLGELIDWLVAAARGFEAIGDQRTTCGVRGHLGYAYGRIGAYTEAELCLREALGASERMNLAWIRAGAKHNLGAVLAHLGAIDEGLRLQTEALQAAEASGDLRMLVGARTYRARILMMKGDRRGAEDDSRAALDVLTADHPMRAPALATLADVLLADEPSGVRRDEAVQHARAAMDILRAKGGLDDGEAIVRLAYAKALDAAGDRPAARAAIGEARDAVLEQAARLSNPHHQSRFELVPEHAEILRLACAWGVRSEAPGDTVTRT